MCGKGTLKYIAVDFARTGVDASKLGYFPYEGEFFNDKFHGVGSQVWTDFTYEGQYYEGRRHGKCTIYMNSGEVFNMKYRYGKEVARKEIDDPSQAWYGDGKSLKEKENFS